MNWQHRVATFARRHGLLHTPVAHALDLAAEVGEIAKAVLESTEYGNEPFQTTDDLRAEIGDALYSLLTLAESCGVDAGEALEEALAKYERRLAQSGRAGSQTAGA
ncbi:MAG TPA: nucleotide pyrophosphohydrolase [Thermoflexia bacterium]|jgi:NTP pyrophosphatase (non-canonical NTP hydrolase)|nr:nucleotide pyrophosphohydrolase [Thermoflexia bacterium]